MLGSASNVKQDMFSARVDLNSSLRLTRSHVWREGGTTKIHAERAVVSPVSPVSPYLQIIEDEKMGNVERQRQALVAALPEKVGQVRLMQQPCGLRGETIGVEHG